MQKSVIEEFLDKESSAGIILMFAAVLAMIAANTPLSAWYDLLIDTPVAVQVGKLEIAKPLLLWINDGLMAVFFLLVGLELKREVLEGELSDPANIVFPAIGAVGGMLVPAAIYYFFNQHDPVTLKGWAIPAATDIAFALGILSLLGSRVPVSLKIFLTSLAIFDDLGAIIIIALFYTSKISVSALIVAAICTAILGFMNYRGISDRSRYVFVGVVMWVAMLKSGVHATLAGVIIAMFIPIKHQQPDQPSPLKEMEHDLHGVVAFFILPIFAFANAGISLEGVTFEQILHPVPLGIAAGLFVGKQVGIFGLCWLGIKLGLAKLPKGMSFLSLYGISLLCGVGFTMSLFIGSLAFEETGAIPLFDERLGIILGSLLSGGVGFIVLNFSLKPKAQKVA
ncbi:Na+/H+ antiporter NhaA [Planctobacterium marinum]|uniref:Na+/H+ antiporter NhaA n=1 Tax=Planctobacterium marinum TaxID=1631968 RepID=UPI001E341A7E|nr:Na+/H+ antiporter NhaA [Planctobacterium marinum]MCC2606430.1 Na+/H+ antiporter NhaA [Planctobacterium marinum]